MKILGQKGLRLLHIEVENYLCTTPKSVQVIYSYTDICIIQL
jgi:hypothetical protein